MLSETLVNDLLEAQCACGKIFDPKTGKPMELSDAIKQGFFPQSLTTRALRAYNIGFRGMDDNNVKRSLIEAIEMKRIDERTGLKYINAQV